MRLNLILLLVSVGWLWAATLRAAPVGFDIPAQPGHTALMAFARTAGADVLFAAEELKRVRTTAVIGTFEPDAALEQMLAGTGFTGERTTKGKFVVRRTPTPSEQSARPLPPEPPKKTRSGGGRVASYADEIVRLDRMVVTPSRFGVADERLAVDATLTSAQLEVLPQLGEDLYRTIARMPGLVADDLTAMFWVRGAPNRQVLSRLDGVDLIEPFHLKDYDGSISIVDLETIASINFSPTRSDPCGREEPGQIRRSRNNRTAATPRFLWKRPHRRERRLAIGRSRSRFGAAQPWHLEPRTAAGSDGRRRGVAPHARSGCLHRGRLPACAERQPRRCWLG